MRVRRSLYIAISVFLAVSGGLISRPNKVSAFSGSGNGTPSDPYLISTCLELQEINNDLDAHYKLSQDINCVGTKVWNGGLGFTPIGDNLATSFTGSFDGDSHIIYNLHIDNPTRHASGNGLFGSIGSGGSVREVGLVHGLVTGSNNIGGIAGFNSGTIEYVFADIQTFSPGDNLGGFVGTNNLGGVIRYAYSLADVYTDEGAGIGGFVGVNSGTIEYAYSAGILYWGQVSGAFAGIHQAGSLSHIATLTWVFATNDVGFVADFRGGSLSDLYWSSDYSGPANCWNDLTAPTSGNTGCTDVGDYTYFFDTSHPPFTEFTTVGHTLRDNTDAMPTFIWHDPRVIPSVPFAGGSGTAGDPYQISTCEQLQALNAQYDTSDKHYHLINDIDCSMTNPSDTDYSATGIWGDEQGFLPIGMTFHPFEGTFDGNGYTVQGMYIDREESYVGLFSEVADNSSIANVTLVDPVVTGDGYFTGSLAGESMGNISNVSATNVTVNGTRWTAGLIGRADVATLERLYASGTITSNDQQTGGLIGELDESTLTYGGFDGDVTGDSETGGLVGGIGDTASTITKSYATGSVTTTVDRAGGLVGIVEADDVVIEKSFSHSDIQSNDGSGGGLVGYVSYDNLALRDTYASGDVNGDTNIGGLVGEGSDNMTIIRSYASGAINTAATNNGGLVGDHLAGATYENSFFDTQTTGTNYSCDTNQLCTGITGKTTTQMKQKTTFSSATWDFDSVWRSSADSNNGYPCQYWYSECWPASDNDGVADAIEQQAPNNGDANLDGVADSRQPHVAAVRSDITNKYVVIALGTNCSLTAAAVKNESTFAFKDAGYDYDNGLAQFKATCDAAGQSTPVSLLHYDVSLGDQTVRKYNPNTNAYFTISPGTYGATISQQTGGGKTITKISYNVTDGGVLDIDGLSNAVIEDPAGLSTAAVSAPNTGFAPATY